MNANYIFLSLIEFERKKGLLSDCLEGSWLEFGHLELKNRHLWKSSWGSLMCRNVTLGRNQLWSTLTFLITDLWKCDISFTLKFAEISSFQAFGRVSSSCFKETKLLGQKGGCSLPIDAKKVYYLIEKKLLFCPIKTWHSVPRKTCVVLRQKV